MGDKPKIGQIFNMATTMLTRLALRSTRVSFFALKGSFSLACLRPLSLSAKCLAKSDRVYTEKHEWIVLGPDNIGTVGISEHAQESLGEIVYVQLPEVGAEVEEDGEAGCVESVKAASDIYSPASGKIVEVNTKLTEKPDLINTSPLVDGWVFKLAVADSSRLKNLMDEEKYKAFLKSQ